MDVWIRRLSNGKYKLRIEDGGIIYNESILPPEQLPKKIVRQITMKLLGGEDLSVECKIKYF